MRWMKAFAVNVSYAVIHLILFILSELKSKGLRSLERGGLG